MGVFTLSQGKNLNFFVMLYIKSCPQPHLPPKSPNTLRKNQSNHHSQSKQAKKKTQRDDDGGIKQVYG
jgi:hypothetical protein